MKKRFQGKSATIAVLGALIIISLIEVAVRGMILRKAMGNLSDAGEPIITVLFSIMLIIFSKKGKDRIFYILCASWLGYFVLKQLFMFPGIIGTFVALMKKSDNLTAFSVLVRLFSMFSIVGIGGLLVEYMNDGSIYNKPFNILCAVTILMYVISIMFGIYDIVVLKDMSAVILLFNNISQIAMVFLFVFFAYDSAKSELSKTNLTK